MAKQQVTTDGQVGIRSMLENGQVHRYVLNDDKALKIMVNHAGLPPLSAPDQTPQTSKLQLSTGSFSQVILPLFSYWGRFDLTQAQQLVEGDIEVTLKEVITGLEMTKKRVDYLAKFDFRGKSISAFAYCTNQGIMIQGLLHEDFLNLFLSPLLAKMMAAKANDIVAFNSKIEEILTTKTDKVDNNDSVWTLATPDRESLSVKLRRNTKCDICGKVCSGISQLKIHITNSHSDSTRAKPRAGVKHTRTLVTTLPRVTTEENNRNVIELLESSDDDELLEVTFPDRSSPPAFPSKASKYAPAFLPYYNTSLKQTES